MEDVLAMRDAYRLENWAQVIQAQQSSGMSKRAFCQKEGISERQFYYWLKRLRESLVDTVEPQLVDLHAPGNQGQSMLKIEMGEARLDLSGTVDMDAVAAILISLQTVSEQVHKLLCGLRLYRFAAWDRWTSLHHSAPIWNEPEGGQSVPILREKNRPNQGAVLVRRWICAGIG